MDAKPRIRDIVVLALAVDLLSFPAVIVSAIIALWFKHDGAGSSRKLTPAPQGWQVIGSGLAAVAGVQL